MRQELEKGVIKLLKEIGSQQGEAIYVNNWPDVVNKLVPLMAKVLERNPQDILKQIGQSPDGNTIGGGLIVYLAANSGPIRVVRKLEGMTPADIEFQVEKRYSEGAKMVVVLDIVPDTILPPK